MNKGLSYEKTHQGFTNVWLTPKYIIDALGPFDLDPCAATHRLWDNAIRNIVESENGLKQSWGGGLVWCNPPYGPYVGAWLRRMAQHKNGIALVFARTDTKAMQEAIGASDAIFLLEGRIRFIKSDNTEGQFATAPSMFLAYGKEAVRRLAQSPLKGHLLKVVDRHGFDD
jgi:DNA N-6-adenine-methyltransferase (Dam)